MWGLIVANLAVLNLDYVKTRKVQGKVLDASTSCPTACVNLINSAKSTSKELTVSISASGTTVKTDWVTVSGSEITFNKANYPGAKKFYFQANLSSDAADRTSYARLYDITHSIAVQGGDVSSSSITLKQVQSGELNPFSGDLTLGIQIKGLNGNLVTISNPRIVVKY